MLPGYAQDGSGLAWLHRSRSRHQTRHCCDCAVFVGREGLGPWQTEEMSVAINRRVCDIQQRFRVIPVLLPGAKRDSLPALLVSTTWVEFRGTIDDSDAFRRLVCGIRGIAPGPLFSGPDDYRRVWVKSLRIWMR